MECPSVVATVGVPSIYGSPCVSKIMSEVIWALTNRNAASARIYCNPSILSQKWSFLIYAFGTRRLIGMQGVPGE